METKEFSVTDLNVHPAFKKLGIPLPSPTVDEIESIQQFGVTKPLCVVHSPADNQHYIIDGISTWRACGYARQFTVTALLRTDLDEEEIEAYLQRTKHQSPMDKAEAIQAALDNTPGLTCAAIAKQDNVSRGHLSSLLKLLRLPAPIKEMVRNDQIKLGHAKSLFRLSKQRSLQLELAHAIVRRRLTIRQTEKIVVYILKDNKTLLKAIKAVVGQAPVAQSQEHTDEDPDDDTTLQPDIPFLSKDLNDDINISGLEEELSQRMGNAVRFHQVKGQQGIVVIHYNNYDELDGIMSHLQ